MECDCLEKLKAEFTLAVSPEHLEEDLTAVVQSKLWAKCCKYSEPLNGIPLSFSNITFNQHNTLVHSGSGMSEIVARTDIILFHPRIGSRLMGIVMHVSADGMVVLALNVFLAIIRSDAIAEAIKFNAENQCYQYVDDSKCSIKVGSAVAFTVTQLHYGGEFFSMKGSIGDLNTEGLCKRQQSDQ